MHVTLSLLQLLGNGFHLFHPACFNFLISLQEEFFNYHICHACMFSCDKDILECFEFFVIPNQVIINLQRLLLDYSVQIVLKRFQMTEQSMNKVFDGMFSLIDAINLFLSVVLTFTLWLVWVWNHFKPDVYYSNCKCDWEVYHEYCRLKFCHAEIFEI